jgi:hypothetical protein
MFYMDVRYEGGHSAAGNSEADLQLTLQRYFLGY